MGNKALTYPVGMLTADEVMLSGLPYKAVNASEDSYLYTGFAYHTMTPGGLYRSGGVPKMFTFLVYGNSGYFDVSTRDTYIRPAISLNRDTMIYGEGGDGTKEHSYEIVMQ